MWDSKTFCIPEAKGLRQVLGTDTNSSDWVGDRGRIVVMSKGRGIELVG